MYLYPTPTPSISMASTSRRGCSLMIYEGSEERTWGGEVGDGGVGAPAEVIRKTGKKVFGVTSGQREGHKETCWWNQKVQECIETKRSGKKKWDKHRDGFL